jgi:hypothetical protein
MNQKTAKLIRKVLNKRFPEDTAAQHKARCQKAKIDWNNTPRNKRGFSRVLLKSFLTFDFNKLDLTQDANPVQ